VPMNDTAVENALQALVARATGIPGARVVWEDQKADRPTKPFCTLELDGDTSPSTSDEQVTSDAPVPAPGADLVLATRVHAEFTLTVRAFTDSITGSGSARVLLRKVRNAFGLDAEIEALDLAGVAVVDRGSVQQVTAVLETKAESRAQVDVRFRVADGAEQITTWIETVGEVEVEFE
jgi:hypothetical protein